MNHIDRGLLKKTEKPFVATSETRAADLSLIAGTRHATPILRMIAEKNREGLHIQPLSITLKLLMTRVTPLSAARPGSEPGHQNTRSKQPVPQERLLLRNTRKKHKADLRLFA